MSNLKLLSIVRSLNNDKSYNFFDLNERTQSRLLQGSTHETPKLSQQIQDLPLKDAESYLRWAAAATS